MADDFDREEAAFRVDEITRAQFMTLVEGRCTRCEAVIDVEELGPDNVANARIDHAEPCIAGESGLTELDELVGKYRFKMGTAAAVIQKEDGKRVLYMGMVRLDDGPEVVR